MKPEAIKYIPVNLINIIVSFGTIVILTRLLSAAEFGRYALVMTIILFVHMGLFTWLEAAMARFYERAVLRDSIGTHYKSLYYFAFAFIFISFSVIWVVLHLLPVETQIKTLLAYAITGTAIHLIYNLTQEGHKASHSISRYSMVHSAQLILSFSIGIALVMFTSLREAGPFLGMIIGGAIAILGELPFLMKQMRTGVFDQKLVQEYFVYGVPISFSLILAYALENGDLFFIKYYMNDASVGAYSAGYNLASRSFDFIFVWLAMAVMPVAISSLEQKGIGEATNILRDYCNVLLMITMPAAVGIALVSNEAVFVLGESVRMQSATIMPWIGFAALLNGFINYYVHQAFVLAKKLHILAAIMILPVAINFALNIIFIPKFGLHGAVIATLCAYGVAAIITIIVARRIFILPLPLMTLAKCAIGCAVMAVCVMNVPIPSEWPDVIKLGAKTIMGATIYVSIIYWMDIAQIRQHLKNLTYLQR